MAASTKKDFIVRDGECAYCEFEGTIVAFENGTGEEVEICGGCIELALDAVNGDFEPRRI
jgi:hypothetical protein